MKPTPLRLRQLSRLSALAALVPLFARAQEPAVPPGDPRAGDPQAGGLQRVDPAQEGAAPSAPDDPRDLFAGKFDPARWSERLQLPDLARRERVFAQLVERARFDPVARAWIEELARDPAGGELAWTARLALREVGRAHFPLRGLPGATDPMDLFGRMEQRMQELFSQDPNLLLPAPGREGHAPQTGARGLGRSVHVEQGPDGARVRVTETVDGEEVLLGEYSGKDLGEILRVNPELANELGGLRLEVQPGSPFDLRFDLGGGGEEAWLERFFGPRQNPSLVPQGFSRPIVTDKLGVNVEPLSADRATELGLPGPGLLVQRAVPQTYAHLLGVVAGDLLVELDGQPLREVADIERGMHARGTDDPLTLVWIDRLGQRREKTWRPGERR